MMMLRTVELGVMATVAACLLVGCGGTGAATSQFTGSYDGTVVNPGKSSTSVTVAVNPDGTISGTCSVLSSISGAIVSRATITGSANSTTGEFVAAGMFQTFLPPPPDGSGTGPVTVSGTLPPKGVASGPLQVQDSVVALHGVISPVASP